jgi:hypothetical protein
MGAATPGDAESPLNDSIDGICSWRDWAGSGARAGHCLLIVQAAVRRFCALSQALIVYSPQVAAAGHSDGRKAGTRCSVRCYATPKDGHSLSTTSAEPQPRTAPAFGFWAWCLMRWVKRCSYREAQSAPLGECEIREREIVETAEGLCLFWFSRDREAESGVEVAGPPALYLNCQ